MTIGDAAATLRRMTATELFTKACEAWGVEISEIVADPKDFQPRRILRYQGQELSVNWEPERVGEIREEYSEDAAHELVRAIMDQLVCQLLARCESHA